jgi:hypothetical protein
MVVAEAGVNAQQMRTLERLYQAFERLDGDMMQACYAPQATFDDEIYSLHGAREIGGMWRMHCRSARVRSRGGFRLEVGQFHMDGSRARVRWEVQYRYGEGNRDVFNRVDAEFEFDADGRILRHRDRYSFGRWARQALGWPALVFGWTPLLRWWTRKRAASKLARYLSHHL